MLSMTKTMKLFAMNTLCIRKGKIMKIGDKILYKGRKAFISDKWNPYLINPSLFKTNEIGYAVVTEDDHTTHICCKKDEKYMEIRKEITL